MNKEKQKIIPELRFPEFEKDGDWEKKKLDGIGKPLMCKRIFKEQTSTDPNNSIPFYKIGTFGREADAYIPIDLYNEYKSKYSFPNVGDILISASGTIGRLVVHDGLDAYFQDSNIVWLGNDEKQVTNAFLFYCYSTLVWQTSDGGVIKRLYNSNLKEMEILFPKDPKEQQKIANCLSSLDNVITAETEKLDHLKEHKKGLLQQLFPAKGETKPQFRFPEFENDEDWVLKSLSSISENMSNKRVPITSNVREKGKIPYYGATGVIDYVKDYIFNENLLLISEDGANLIDRNYPIAFSICGKTWVNNHAHVLKPINEHTQTLIEKYINSISIEDYLTGQAQPKLNKENLNKIPIPLPSNPKEQQKIADFLSSLDELIETQTQKIDTLKVHKKGLMQQLFPNV